MGYCTSFTFSIHSYGNTDVTNDKIVRVIRRLFEEKEILDTLAVSCRWQLRDYWNDSSQGGIKIETSATQWSRYDIEMLALSREFPDTVFKLHGEGEWHLDIWDSYYKDGKMCKYALPRELPPFNSDDLHYLG